jgi:hypothetical protein
MKKSINFEDNTFIINIRIRLIRDMLLLDVDPDLFLEKTLDDVEFINRTLSILLEQLVTNDHYLDRNEQLHNLYDTEQRFQEVLSEFSRWEQNFGGSARVIQDHLALYSSQIPERLKSINNQYTDDRETETMEPLVTSDELNELLKS